MVVAICGGRRRGMKIKQCAVLHCEQPVDSRGWCKKHYHRWRRHGDLNTVKQRGRQRTVPVLSRCAYCDRAVYAKGLCEVHYARKYKYKKTEAEMIKPIRQFAPNRGPCTICGRPVHGQGYCQAHYRRYKNNDDPRIVKRRTRATIPDTKEQE